MKTGGSYTRAKPDAALRQVQQTEPEKIGASGKQEPAKAKSKQPTKGQQSETVSDAV